MRIVVTTDQVRSGLMFTLTALAELLLRIPLTTASTIAGMVHMYTSKQLGTITLGFITFNYLADIETLIRVF